VTSQPDGYPWRPKPLSELVGATFVAPGAAADAPLVALPAGTTHAALYFSAHWCPPCRRFTPELVSALAALPPSSGLAVIFVSGDRSADDFAEYHGSMTGFHAVPYADEERRTALKNACDVSGVPSLVLCSYPDMKVLNPAARGVIRNDFPAGWLPPAVPDVNEDDSAVEALNSRPCLLCLAEAAPPAAQAAARAALATLRPGVSVDDLFLGIALAEEQVSSSIRRLCRLGAPADDPAPTLLILDLQDDGAYYPVPPSVAAGAPAVVCDGDVCALVRPGELTAAAAAAAVAAWKAGSLQKMKVAGREEEGDEEEEEEADEEEAE